MLRCQREEIPVDHTLEVMSYLYHAYKRSIHALNETQHASENPTSLISSLISILEDTLNLYDDSWRALKGDQLCDDYFGRIPPVHHQKIATEMCSLVTDELRGFAYYMRSYPSVMTQREDFVKSLYKVFCNSAGTYLGQNTGAKIHALREGI
jgi:hypothetical protein